LIRSTAGDADFPQPFDVLKQQEKVSLLLSASSLNPQIVIFNASARRRAGLGRMRNLF
jgi:hypothetical protein